MYEKFTDRARKVFQLANQEALRFQHEYIGTEHVLLGLVKEGSGVAGNVLRNLGIDLRKIRLEVEKLVASGPDMVNMSKLPQTPRVKRIIEYAMDEMGNLNHNYVGTEHILLGLLREQDGVASQVLVHLGLTLEKVRKEVLDLLNVSADGTTSAEQPLDRWVAEQGARAVAENTERAVLKTYDDMILARIEKLEAAVADLTPCETQPCEVEEEATPAFKPGDTVHTPKGIGTVHSIARDCGKNIFVTFTNDDSRESFLAEDCWLVKPTEFVECSVCAAKPGMPVMCPSCLHNRTAISKLTPPPSEAKEEKSTFTPGDRVNTPDGPGTVQDNAVGDPGGSVPVWVDDDEPLVVSTAKWFEPGDISPLTEEKTTGLTWKEAEAWMDRGEKVRRKPWDAGVYVKIDDGYVYWFCSTGRCEKVNNRPLAKWKGDTATDWEVVQ